MTTVVVPIWFWSCRKVGVVATVLAVEIVCLDLFVLVDRRVAFKEPSVYKSRWVIKCPGNQEDLQSETLGRAQDHLGSCALGCEVNL